MGNDISEVKGDVKDLGRKMEALLLNWESAKSTYVSAEAHNQSLQAIRAEVAQSLEKHSKEHGSQLATIQADISKLNSAYLKMVGAGIVAGIILSQLKNIIEWLS